MLAWDRRTHGPPPVPHLGMLAYSACLVLAIIRMDRTCTSYRLHILPVHHTHEPHLYTRAYCALRDGAQLRTMHAPIHAPMHNACSYPCAHAHTSWRHARHSGTTYNWTTAEENERFVVEWMHARHPQLELLDADGRPFQKREPAFVEPLIPPANEPEARGAPPPRSRHNLGIISARRASSSAHLPAPSHAPWLSLLPLCARSASCTCTCSASCTCSRSAPARSGELRCDAAPLLLA